MRCVTQLPEIRCCNAARTGRDARAMCVEVYQYGGWIGFEPCFRWAPPAVASRWQRHRAQAADTLQLDGTRDRVERAIDTQWGLPVERAFLSTLRRSCSSGRVDPWKTHCRPHALPPMGPVQLHHVLVLSAWDTTHSGLKDLKFSVLNRT